MYSSDSDYQRLQLLRLNPKDNEKKQCFNNNVNQSKVSLLKKKKQEFDKQAIDFENSGWKNIQSLELYQEAWS